MVIETRWNDNWNLSQVNEEIARVQSEISAYKRRMDEHMNNLTTLRDKLQLKLTKDSL